MIQTKLDVQMNLWRAKNREKLTQEMLADRAGLARSTVLDWANGKVQRFDARILESFCAFFGCQPGDLLEYIPDS